MGDYLQPLPPPSAMGTQQSGSGGGVGSVILQGGMLYLVTTKGPKFIGKVANSRLANSAIKGIGSRFTTSAEGGLINRSPILRNTIGRLTPNVASAAAEAEQLTIPGMEAATTASNGGRAAGLLSKLGLRGGAAAEGAAPQTLLGRVAAPAATALATDWAFSKLNGSPSMLSMALHPTEIGDGYNSGTQKNWLYSHTLGWGMDDSVDAANAADQRSANLIAETYARTGIDISAPGAQQMARLRIIAEAGPYLSEDQVRKLEAEWTSTGADNATIKAKAAALSAAAAQAQQEAAIGPRTVLDTKSYLDAYDDQTRLMGLAGGDSMAWLNNLGPQQRAEYQQLANDYMASINENNAAYANLPAATAISIDPGVANANRVLEQNGIGTGNLDGVKTASDASVQAMANALAAASTQKGQHYASYTDSAGQIAAGVASAAKEQAKQALAFKLADIAAAKKQASVDLAIQQAQLDSDYYGRQLQWQELTGKQAAAAASSPEALATAGAQIVAQATDPEQQKVLTQMATRIATGENIYAVFKDFYDQGYDFPLMYQFVGLAS